MAKEIGANPAVQAFKDVTQRLENQEGINLQMVDAWLQAKGLSAVMEDHDLLKNYFGVAAKGLRALTETPLDLDKFQSLNAEVYPPSFYQSYYTSERDTSIGTEGVDYMRWEYISNPQYLVQNNYLDKNQGVAFAKLLKYGLFATGDPDNPQSPSTPSAPQGPSTPTSGQAPATNYPGGSNAPGSSKNMGMGGTSKSYGGAGAGGLPPPPPPPPAPGMGGPMGGGGAPQAYNFVPLETDYLQTLQGGVAAQWLGQLFQDSNYVRGSIYQAMNQLQGLKSTRQQLIGMIEGLDPRDPQQAHRIMALREELGMLTDSERELVDKMQQLKRLETERATLIKGLIDTDNRVRNDIIRNMRQ